MTGAACLTALAALRADAGYVTLAVPEESLAVAEGIALEPVKVGWCDDDAVETIAAAAERASALAHRPRPRARRRERARSFASCSSGSTSRRSSTRTGSSSSSRSSARRRLVLTPHAGELGAAARPRLRAGSARIVSRPRAKPPERFQAVVLLKGTDTIVASPDGTAVVSDFGPPSLATAGTGDVLTGVVAAFLAKGVEPMTAAAAAAVAHGLAAAARSAPVGTRRERPPAVPARRARALTRRQFPAGETVAVHALTTPIDLPRSGE